MPSSPRPALIFAWACFASCGRICVAFLVLPSRNRHRCCSPPHLQHLQLKDNDDVFLKRSTIISSSTMKNSISIVEGKPFSSQIFKDVWGREPLLMRQAFPNDQGEEDDCWPSWDIMVNDIAHAEDGMSRIITHVPGELTSYDLTVGPPFDEAAASFLRDQYAHESSSTQNRHVKSTLVVNDVDRFHTPLSDWMDRTFDFLPRWRRDDAQISLANRGGGIGPHVDNYDVFLIQVSGARRWQVGLDALTVQEEVAATLPDSAVRILADWDTTRRHVAVELKPGDVLYLPPRFAHCGTALTDECATLSVGCRAPSATDLVSRLAECLSPSTTSNPEAVRRYHDKDLLLKEEGSITSELTDDVKMQMKDLIRSAVEEVLEDDAQFDALVGQLVTESVRARDYYPLPLEECEWRQELGLWGVASDAVQAVCNGEGVLYRAEGIAAAYSRVMRMESCLLSYRLFMNGRVFEIPSVTCEEEAAVKTLLEAIASAPAITGETLAPLSHQPAVMHLVENLVDQGLLYGSDED